jgi:excisionase family DNA binding protein
VGDEYISMNEAAEFLNVTRLTLYRWAKSGKLKIYKKGRNSIIKKTDAERVKREMEQIRPLYE